MSDKSQKIRFLFGCPDTGQYLGALVITIGVHLISGVGIPDAKNIPGSRYLNTWVRTAGRATFIIGTLAIIMIFPGAQT